MERFQGAASQLMTQRIIRLGGAVDDDSCNLIVAQLLWLDAMDAKKDITIYVNSPGGSVTAGMAVFDTMRRAPRRVHGVRRPRRVHGRVPALRGAAGQALQHA